MFEANRRILWAALLQETGSAVLCFDRMVARGVERGTRKAEPSMAGEAVTEALNARSGIITHDGSTVQASVENRGIPTCSNAKGHPGGSAISLSTWTTS
jgi:hypothetical protein